MAAITFDEIPAKLRALLDELGNDLVEISTLYAIRDLWGRVRFLVPQRPEPSSRTAKALEQLARSARERLGAHAHPPSQAVLYATDLESGIDGLTTLPSFEIAPGPPVLRLIDRQITGLSWATVEEGAPAPYGLRRVAFYSIKGGVGRSTAAAAAAWHLAREGQTVLVLDLDLEAPGLSSSLLPADRQPEFGIVDWFVEDAVDQSDAVVSRMTAASPLANDLPGEIWVVPSHGAAAGEYIAKLGRCYLDLPREGAGEPWEHRLMRLLRSLEEARSPDVVLLDVRSGFQDLASVALTDLGADVLLFAVGTVQTWSAYRLLFEHWRRAGVISALRERLQVIAALVPETERQVYLSSFQQDAWDLFLNHVYDVVEGAEIDAFSFDLSDPSAPHHPVPIFWHRGLATLSTFDDLDPQLVEAAFGLFLERLVQLLSAREGTTE